MKILVTGGAGYCGVPLTGRLLSAGHDVTVVDNFLFGYDSLLHLVSHAKLRIVTRDIRNQDRSYLKDKDVVFHLAALSGQESCQTNAHSADEINVTATAEMLSTLSRQQLFIFASTISLYGCSDSLSTEETEPAPVNIYGVTKLRAEKLVMQRCRSIVLRWATVYGISPRMRAGLLINDLARQAVQEGAIVLYDAHSRRSFIHIQDVVRGYLFALEHETSIAGQIFNMGSEQFNYTKREVAAAIQRRHHCEVFEGQRRDSDIRNYTVAFQKCQSEGFACEHGFEQGLDELIRLYQFYAPHSFVRPI